MRVGVLLLIVLAAIAGGIYWLALDGSTPQKARYEFPIKEMRALIDASEGPPPSALNVEIISTDEAPLMAAHAGLHFEPFHLSMVSFQVKGEAGDIVIGSAMDKSLFDENHQSDSAVFSSEAYERMIAAMQASKATLITHEHIDHLGGLARAPQPETLAPVLMLSSVQIAAISSLTRFGSAPEEYQNLTAADLSTPRLLAPGVAVAPAPGHTPGSQIFLIRAGDGFEYLLVGDIVWTMKNVEKAWGRPRLLQYMFFSSPEDRATVQRQVRALHDLSESEPNLILLPCHDKDYIDELIAAGKLGGQFQL